MFSDIPIQLDYNASLIWLVSNNCNLKCEYCTSKVERKEACYSTVNIHNVIKTFDSTGKTFHIIFAGGGEPFSTPEIVNFSDELTKKHFISFITNNTSLKIREFSERIDPSRVKLFKTSLHIKELEQKGLLERFIENFLFLKNKKFPVSAYAVAHPSLLSKLEANFNYFRERGISFQYEYFIGNYNGKNYPYDYTADELKAFSLDTAILKPDMLLRKNTLCNAGFNIGFVTNDGFIFTCYSILENIGNLNTSIKFNDYLIKCPVKTCLCPLTIVNYELFLLAIKETEKYSTKPLVRLSNYFGISLRDKNIRYKNNTRQSENAGKLET